MSPAGRIDAARTMRGAAVWSYIALLAWAPFPLGGAISWGAGLQECFIALCWTLWAVSSWLEQRRPWRDLRAVAGPAILVALTLIWAIIQTLPIVPQTWTHPLWGMTSELLGKPLPATISLDPWRSEGEILKLASTAMAGWLAYVLARRSDTAALLLDAVIAIGAIYALYAFVLALAGMGQSELFYNVPYPHSFISGPFMLHNSFATYSGLAAVAALVRMFNLGGDTIVARRGTRQLVLTTMQYLFGRGAWVVVATLLAFGGVVASASRAGFAATTCGLFVVAVAALVIARRGRKWAGAGAIAAVLPLLLLLVFSAGSLNDRMTQLVDAETPDVVRLALWDAAYRMIGDAPWLGLGLGAFPDAYPLYASRIFPYVMDKAHCDYLEFAAGAGLPAALALWSAVAWLAFLCGRGLVRRRRNRHYALIALGAVTLVAVHSAVDFSLQLPAVALSFATLLGIGVAQSFSTGRRADDPAQSA
jgi:O-antigen ligase